MRVAVIGLGVMGKNHLRVLQALPSVDEIVVHDVVKQQIADSRKVQFVASVDELIATKPDYAVVAIPTTYHAATAIALAKAGIATLLEKPDTSIVFLIMNLTHFLLFENCLQDDNALDLICLYYIFCCSALFVCLRSPL